MEPLKVVFSSNLFFFFFQENINVSHSFLSLFNVKSTVIGRKVYFQPIVKLRIHFFALSYVTVAQVNEFPGDF